MRLLRYYLRQLLLQTLYLLPESGIFKLNELNIFFIVVCLHWLHVSFCLKSPYLLLKFLIKRSRIIVSCNKLLINGLMSLQFHLIGVDHSLCFYLLSKQSLVIFPQLLIVLLVFAYCLLQLLVQLFASFELIVALFLPEVECLLPLHIHSLCLLEFPLGKFGFQPLYPENEFFLLSL